MGKFVSNRRETFHYRSEQSTRRFTERVSGADLKKSRGAARRLVLRTWMSTSDRQKDMARI